MILDPRPWCIYACIHNANIHDPWPWCMYRWCGKFVPDQRTDQRTDEQGDSRSWITLDYYTILKHTSILDQWLSIAWWLYASIDWSDLSHIKVLLSSTYHATTTPLFSDSDHIIVPMACTYHTTLAPVISDLMRPITHKRVPFASTFHATPNYISHIKVGIPCSRASNAFDIPCSKFITGGRIAHSCRRHGTVTDVNDARVSSPRCVCVICILHCPWRLHTGCRSETNYFHTQGNTPWTAWQ